MQYNKIERGGHLNCSQLEPMLRAAEEAYVAADTSGLPTSDQHGSEAAVGWDEDLDVDASAKAPSASRE